MQIQIHKTRLLKKSQRKHTLDDKNTFVRIPVVGFGVFFTLDRKNSLNRECADVMHDEEG